MSKKVRDIYYVNGRYITMEILLKPQKKIYHWGNYQHLDIAPLLSMRNLVLSDIPDITEEQFKRTYFSNDYLTSRSLSLVILMETK